MTYFSVSLWLLKDKENLNLEPFGSNNSKVAENLKDWTLIPTFPSKTDPTDIEEQVWE